MPDSYCSQWVGLIAGHCMPVANGFVKVYAIVNAYISYLEAEAVVH